MFFLHLTVSVTLGSFPGETWKEYVGRFRPVSGGASRVVPLQQSYSWSTHHLKAAGTHPCPALGLSGRGGPSQALTFSQVHFKSLQLTLFAPLVAYGNHCRSNRFFVISLQRLNLLQWTAELKVFKTLFIIPCNKLLKAWAFPKCISSHVMWQYPQPGHFIHHATPSSSVLCTGQKLHGTTSNSEKKKERCQSLKYSIYSLSVWLIGIECTTWDGKSVGFQEKNWKRVIIVNNFNFLVCWWLIAS